MKGSLLTTSAYVTIQIRGGDLPFPFEGNDNPRGASLVDLLFDLGGEADGTHDAVTELLVEDGLVGVAVVLDNLVEPVDERFYGRHGSGAAPIGEGSQLRSNFLPGQFQELGQAIDIFRRCGRLAVEQGSTGNLTAT